MLYPASNFCFQIPLAALQPVLRACIDESMRLHPPVTRLPARVGKAALNPKP